LFGRFKRDALVTVGAIVNFPNDIERKRARDMTWVQLANCDVH